MAAQAWPFELKELPSDLIKEVFKHILANPNPFESYKFTVRTHRSTLNAEIGCFNYGDGIQIILPLLSNGLLWLKCEVSNQPNVGGVGGVAACAQNADVVFKNFMAACINTNKV
jgi:hypothetical protein